MARPNGPPKSNQWAAEFGIQETFIGREATPHRRAIYKDRIRAADPPTDAIQHIIQSDATKCPSSTAINGLRGIKVLIRSAIQPIPRVPCGRARTSNEPHSKLRSGHHQRSRSDCNISKATQA